MVTVAKYKKNNNFTQEQFILFNHREHRGQREKKIKRGRHGKAEKTEIF
jgi:hypothetical protein